MAYDELVASLESHARDIVFSQTWGHLAPKMSNTYRGNITFACASYGGDVAILSLEFVLPDGTPLDDNPWSYEDLSDYISQWVCDCANGWRDGKSFPKQETDGKIYTFTGSYTRFKNNNCRIAGKFRERAII